MTAPVRYHVSPANLHEHLFEVETTFPVSSGSLTVWMPVWTPGSYLLREYSRHVQQFSAEDTNGRPLKWTRDSKNNWTIACAGLSEVRVRYRVYANEITVRTSHLDGSHGYFNGATMFVTSDAHRDGPALLTLSMPQAWKAFCALPEAGNGFQARNFDELIDSPVEMGPHEPVRFTAAGKPHELVLWGHGNYDREQLAKDITAIVETEAAIFGGLPFEKYLFLVLLSDKGRGGLEHAASTALLYPRFGFRPRKSYEDFLSLVAHEYFHLWNVKRIKPKRLVPFDYQRENYTDLLWAFEGFTSYYDTYMLRRANLIDAKRYLERMGEAISAVELVPARKVQSLDEASHYAWIKYYRQDENTPNSAISYYVKGEVVAMLLDLHIRKATGGKKSLDDVMRLLFERYGDGSGVPEDGVEKAALEIGGPGLAAFFEQAIHRPGELDYSSFEDAGLALRRRPRKNDSDKGGTREDVDANKSWLGFTLKGSGTTVGTVYSGSPAAAAGIYADDELLALDGYKITQAALNERLDERKPGDKVRLTLFRRDELREIEVELGARPADAVFLEKRVDATPSQRALYEAWLGEPFGA